MQVDYLLKKGTKKLNEDAVLIGDDVFGVFDGASSSNSLTYEEEKTGGFLASHIAKEVFQKNDSNLCNLFKKANNQLRLEMKNRKVNLKNKINLWATTLAVIKINFDSFDWIQVSDSLILIIFKDSTYKLLVDNYDHDKETLVLWREIAKQKEKDIKSKLKKELAANRKRMNIDYGVLDGELGAINFSKQGNEKLENVRHILLFTDGLIVPKEDPRKNDNFDKLVELFLDKGLVGWSKYINDLTKLDPYCWRFPRFSDRDDQAGIAITL